MFGFKKHSEKIHPAEVVPALEDLMKYEYLVQSGKILPDHPVYSILAGRHASKLRGRGLDFEEARLYVAGDDIRNIDWRVTARTGQTYSKVFNEEKERPTFLVVDQSSQMFFGSQRFVKSVVAAHAAALGAFYTIKRGDRVGGLIFNEEEQEFITPKRSKAQVQYLLQSVCKLSKKLPEKKHISGKHTELLNEMLKRTLNSITHDYVVTIISDFSNIDEDTKKYLRNISNHNDVILIHIYDALDQQLPNERLILGNGDREILWQNKKRNWGEKYKTDFIDFKQQFTDEFRKYRIPVVFFNTAETIQDQVMRDMSKRL